MAAGAAVDPAPVTFRYDLVNTGREVISQLALPLSMDFAAAYNSHQLDAARLKSSGNAYCRACIHFPNH